MQFGVGAENMLTRVRQSNSLVADLYEDVFALIKINCAEEKSMLSVPVSSLPAASEDAPL